MTENNHKVQKKLNEEYMSNVNTFKEEQKKLFHII